VILSPSNTGGERRRIQPAEGFSLIEIMVAVGLLAVIIVGLLAMFYHVQRAFRAGVTQSDVMEGGRATMGLLARELQEATSTDSHDFEATNFVAMPSPGTGAWGESSAQNLPSGAERKNFLQDVTFLTRANGNWKGISYRIENNGGGGVGILKRLEASLPYDPNPYSASNGLFTFGKAFFSQTVDKNTNYHRVLDGVVHLYVTAYDTNGFVFTNAWLSPNGGYAFTGFTNVMPAYIDVELGVLEPSAIDRFRASQEVGGAAPQNYLRRQVGRTHLFRQRISIRPAASQLSTD
jgi:Tfp pilus assembly protein PilV